LREGASEGMSPMVFSNLRRTHKFGNASPLMQTTLFLFPHFFPISFLKLEISYRVIILLRILVGFF
jgi:hypothetical protein